MNGVEINQITFRYHDIDVLQDVSCHIQKGSLSAIIGPNGAGKSTLLKIILGLLEPDKGNIKINGMNVNQARKQHLLSYVPQKESVDWYFPISALDVVLMGRYAHLGPIRRPSKKDKFLALNALEKFGMKEFGKNQIGDLSGGQQQRVFLARSYVQDAEYYFLDEPFQNIDTVTEGILIGTLRDLQKKGKTIITVTHDLQSLSKYFDHIVLLNRHKIDCGNPSKVLNHDNLLATYGSHLHIGENHEKDYDHLFPMER